MDLPSGPMESLAQYTVRGVRALDAWLETPRA